MTLIKDRCLNIFVLLFFLFGSGNFFAGSKSILPPALQALAGGVGGVCAGSWDCDNGKSCIGGVCAK